MINGRESKHVIKCVIGSGIMCMKLFFFDGFSIFVDVEYWFNLFFFGSGALTEYMCSVGPLLRLNLYRRYHRASYSRRS